MTKELFELVKGMDLKAAETQIALRCAPLIAGLKVSNLLIVLNEQAGRVLDIFRHTEIVCFILFRGEDKTAMLLYRFDPLLRDLNQPQAVQILHQCGYKQKSLEELLYEFSSRYAAYMHGRAEFPHEIGLFLGYPPEDVDGFIVNGGKNPLYTGYWKVYQNAQEKIRLFQQFDAAKEKMIRLYSSLLFTA